MSFVAVFGYTSVGLLTVWGTRLQGSDVALPVWAALHMVLMIVIGLATAGWFARDRAERGLFAIVAGTGNNGFTGGAFVLYLLYGEEAMGLANIYIMLFLVVAVAVMYPLARHFADETPRSSLTRLILRSLFDWRSIGLPVVLGAMLLSAYGVARPGWIARARVVDILVYTITPLAFFGIGLRLHFSKVPHLLRLVAGLALMRFLVALGVGLAVAWLAQFTLWPITGLRWKVYVIESFVPTAITAVAIAHMFRLRPDEASVLFVVNTAMYLVLVLPVVFWVFG
jgi:predicted permease